MHHDAILDLLRSTGNSLGAELLRREFRRGVPPPSIVGVKELDLPQSYVQKGETIHPLVYTDTIHQVAILDVLRSTWNSLWAEQLRGEVRRGVAIGRGEGIGPAQELCLGGRNNSSTFVHTYYASRCNFGSAQKHREQPGG